MHVKVILEGDGTSSPVYELVKLNGGRVVDSRDYVFEWSAELDCTLEETINHIRYYEYDYERHKYWSMSVPKVYLYGIEKHLLSFAPVAIALNILYGEMEDEEHERKHTKESS